MAIDPNQQFYTANSTQTQSQSPTGQAFLAALNSGKYGQAGLDSWNSNPQSFSVNDFNRIAATNPVMAEQMSAAGGQQYRDAIMQNNKWNNNQMNSFINANGSGALPGFAGYTGAGAGVKGGVICSPAQAAGAYGAGYTGYGGSQVNGPQGSVPGVSGNGANGAVSGTNFTQTGNYGAPSIPAGLYDPWGTTAAASGVRNSAEMPVNTSNFRGTPVGAPTGYTRAATQPAGTVPIPTSPVTIAKRFAPVSGTTSRFSTVNQ